jgi:hypothetical protein
LEYVVSGDIDGLVVGVDSGFLAADDGRVRRDGEEQHKGRKEKSEAAFENRHCIVVIVVNVVIWVQQTEAERVPDFHVLDPSMGSTDKGICAPQQSDLCSPGSVLPIFSTNSIYSVLDGSDSILG